MSITTKIRPTYSHGGVNAPGYPAVVGNTTNSGRPIDIAGANPDAAVWPVFVVFCTGGTATVLIESNGGLLDSTGNPPTSEWVDISGGGYSMTAGTSVAKVVPPTMPYVRTRISAISGATVVSYIPLVYLPDGQVVSAAYPALKTYSVA